MRLRSLFLLGCGLLASCSSEVGSLRRRAAPPTPLPSATVLASVAHGPAELPLPAPDAVVKQISLAEAGLDPQAFDRSVDACEDLYQFACGNWVKTFQMPPDKVTFEKTYSAGTDLTQVRLREIIEQASSNGSTTSQKQLADFYHACMDDERIDKLGIQPLVPYLNKIRSAKDREALGAVVGELHPIIDAFFHIGANPDPQSSKVMVAFMREGGTSGMPTYDYYLSNEPEKLALRKAYIEEALALLELAKMPRKEAHAIVDDAMKIQIALASAMRDMPRNCRPTYMSLEDLESQAPGFPWKQFFQSLGLGDTKHLLVNNVYFIERMAELYRKSTVSELRHYLTWRVVGDVSYVLGTGFREEKAKLQRKIWGDFQEEPRWKQCVAATRSTLRDLLAKEYVDRYFPIESRDGFQAMFDQFVAAFGDRLDELDWMDEPTRKNAHEKLAKMILKMGRSGETPVYELPIDPKNYADDVLAPRLTFGRRAFTRVGGPVNTSWDRSPLDTNAFYGAEENAAIFPAAFLQPPIFNLKANLPVRYGAVGFHLGHEMTHGYDNTGALYDGDGNRKKWWTPEIWKRFQDKTSCLEKQFAAYEPLPGMHVDAKRTLGENVADLGGLKLAFRAYRNARKGAKEVAIAEEFTEDQQFFLSYAQDHCVKFGDTDLRRFIEVNVHSPHWLRVNGATQNLPEFAHAFKCKARADTCEIW